MRMQNKCIIISYKAWKKLVHMKLDQKETSIANVVDKMLDVVGDKE